ncbi:hypothetical protein HQ520_13335 [bacterium]|nr:hypothetical protein [bacterium]
MRLPYEVPQFLFDDTLISHQQRLTRRWMAANVFPEPILKPDQPWEGRMLTLYGSVVRDPGGEWRMYYTNRDPGPGSTYVMVATSSDGLSWRKPGLSVAPWEGRRPSNIVLESPLPMDAPSVIYDPDDFDFPYKMIVFHWVPREERWGARNGLYLYRSLDGLTWNQTPGVRLQAGDMTTVMGVKQNRRFVAYTRHPEMFRQKGAHCIYRTESPNGMNWSDLEMVLAPDLLDDAEVELYGMSVFPRHDWYIGLLQCWRSDIDRIEVHLALSRDGRKWFRPIPREPFIPSNQYWNSAWTTCASNGPIILDEQMAFYFGGRAFAHNSDTVRRHGVIGCASLPLDRFCAIEGQTGGILETAPLEWPGGELILNADTRQSFESHPFHLNGQIDVEILNEDGDPLPAWCGENKAIFRGNTHARDRIEDGTVHWPGRRRMEDLRHNRIRLRLRLEHARLYTIMAGEPPKIDEIHWR